MPEYLAPGVFIEEIPGQKPIEGVGTSTGAFVGVAERGPVGKAVLVTNWTQFVDTFGWFTLQGFLAYSVQQFFAEGGTRCYCVRTCHYSRANQNAPLEPDATTASVDLTDDNGDATLEVSAANGGKWGEGIAIRIEDASDKEDDPSLFKMRVMYRSQEEIFDNLSMSETKPSTSEHNPNFVETQIDGISKLIVVDIPATSSKNRPANTPRDPADPEKFQDVFPQGGEDGLTDASGQGTLGISDFIGDESLRNGLHAFDTIDDINIVAIPDFQDKDLLKQATAYCENRQDCFFVGDPTQGLEPSGSPTDPTTILNYKNGVNSKFGALYYPWITIADPVTGGHKETPPSGAIAGIYSATDVKRGVHKAPAGVIDGYLKTVSNVETVVTKGEQETLNPLGINVIRKFPGAGTVIWGARTLATKSDPEWKYVNVRRLLLFIEESVDEGTQWVVFEPNDPALWARVKRDITAFLLLVWRGGALFGLTPEEAFFVKIDEENNPPESRDAGRLVIDVGVAPVKPAEFVIIRFQQITKSSV